MTAPASTLDRVAACIAQVMGAEVDVEAITPESLFTDLGCDELDVIAVTMECEDEFDLRELDDEKVAGLRTVADLVGLVDEDLGILG